MKRIDLGKESPGAMKAMIGLEKYIDKSGLDRSLYELIKMRASQINGCHYCINMHSRDAMAAGETAQRLFLLDAWWEVDLFTEKEKAALALTDAMTNIAYTKGIPDDIYNEAAKHLTTEELSAVIIGIVAINGWNRIAIVTEMPLD